MELYYQGLTSDEASLEQLVDDLEQVVQVANLPPEPRAEITSRLRRLRAACGVLQSRTVAAGIATDRFVRMHPYSALVAGLSAGLILATLLTPRRARHDRDDGK
jgi:ElaB/YqjD/DUF883 family membrane-anchored ribosome-binding protein